MVKAGMTSRGKSAKRERVRMGVEPLEDRLAPAGLAFSFAVEDPTNALAPFPLFGANMAAAGKILENTFDGKGTIDVLIRVDNSNPRFTGGPGTPVDVATENGLRIVQAPGVSEAQTGIDPNGAEADIFITVQTSTYLPTLFFDPSGAARTSTTDPGKGDLISIAMHEILHGLVFSGYRNGQGANYGQFDNVFRTTYDRLTSFGVGGNPNVLYFTGNSATTLYGGAVPLTSVGPNAFLTSQNFYHLGNPQGQGLPGEDLINTLMNGIQILSGFRYNPTAIDLAVAKDLGMTPIKTTFFPNATATVNEGDGTVSIAITRAGDPTGTASVSYAVTGGTATSDTDFTLNSGTVNWAAGEVGSKTIVLALTNDALAESSETIQLTLSNPSGVNLGTSPSMLVTIVDNDSGAVGPVPAALQGFTATTDYPLAGRVSAGLSQQVALIHSGADFTQPAVRVVNPISGAIVSEFKKGDFANFSGLADRSLVGDTNGDGVSELVQFRRAPASGATLTGPAIRILNLADGSLIRQFNYEDSTAGQTYAQILNSVVDPEDEVFLGKFTQSNQLEALFFNRTNQINGVTSLRVLNLTSGALTDTGVHNGINFNGWIDPTDEFTVADTNFDGLDDIVIVNRVANPEAFRSTQIGFVGMVSLASNAGGRSGSNIGFYRFFDWNFSKPGEASVFPGYDEQADHATFGKVINNGANTAVIVLVNSQTDGNPQAAGYALLQPAPLVQGVRDSFQLISTQFRNVLPAGSFNPDDTFLMADANGDGTDEFIAFSRVSGNASLRAFGAFSGQVLGQIQSAGQASAPVTLSQPESRRPSRVASSDSLSASVALAPNAVAVDVAFSDRRFAQHGGLVESFGLDDLV